MPPPRSRAAVLGTGERALELTGLLAAAGVPCVLLDGRGAKEAAAARVRLATAGALGAPEALGLIQAGPLSGELLGYADVIFDTGSSDLPPVQELYALLGQQASETTYLVGVRLGVSGQSLAELLPEARRANFQRIHLPRRLALRPCAEFVTESSPLPRRLEELLEPVLGLTLIPTRDAACGFTDLLEAEMLEIGLGMMEEGLQAEDIDFLCFGLFGREGGILGRADLLGLAGAREFFALAGREAPPLLRRIADREGAEGRGTGVYRRTLAGLQVFRPATGAYAPAARGRMVQEVGAWLAVGPGEDRWRRALGDEGRAGAVARRLLAAYLACAARHRDAHFFHDEDLDTVARVGAGFSLGPRELFERIGADQVRDRLRMPDGEGPSRRGDVSPGTPPEPRSGGLEPRELERHGPPLESGRGARLWDLGAGIFLFEIMEPMVTPPLLEALHQTLRRVQEEGAGLVLGTQGQHFLAGQDWRPFLALARARRFEEVRSYLRSRVQLHTMIQSFPLPVVCAARGRVVGAGLELAWHCSLVQAGETLALGFDEAAYGLIPAGGGLKELARRVYGVGLAGAAERMIPYAEDVLHSRLQTGMTLACRRGWLNPTDTLNRVATRRILEAKQDALRLAERGWRPPLEILSLEVPGEEGGALLAQHFHRRAKEKGWDHVQQAVARALAGVLCGGQLTRPGRVRPEHMLELEQEAFLALLGMPEIQARLEQVLRAPELFHS